MWDTYTWLFVVSIFLALFVAWVSRAYYQSHLALDAIFKSFAFLYYLISLQS